MSSRVNESTVVDVYRTRPSVVPDSIGDLVRGGLRIGLSYIEPKVIKGGRMRVVLVG